MNPVATRDLFPGQAERSPAETGWSPNGAVSARSGAVSSRSGMGIEPTLDGATAQHRF